MTDNLDPRRWKRIVLFALGGIAIEFGLYGIGRMAPAMASLMRPGYFIAGAIALVAIWNASRRREGNDRRQDERRDASAGDFKA